MFSEKEGQSTGTIDMEGKPIKLYTYKNVWHDNGGNKMFKYMYRYIGII